MASGKRKRGKGKQTKGQYKGSASAHRRARQTLPTYLQGEKDPRPVWSDEPIGYTAPDPDDPGSTATWQHPALTGYGNDDEVPVLVVRPGDEPPPAAGEYIGTVNKTIMISQSGCSRWKCGYPRKTARSGPGASWPTTWTGWTGPRRATGSPSRASGGASTAFRP